MEAPYGPGLTPSKIRRSEHFDVLLSTGAVVVVKWSACLPSLRMIRVRISLTPTVFSVKNCAWINENKQKEAGVGPFLKKYVKLNFAQMNEPLRGILLLKFGSQLPGRVSYRLCVCDLQYFFLFKKTVVEFYINFI